MEEKIEATHIIVERVMDGVWLNSVTLTNCQIHIGVNLQPVTGAISTTDTVIILKQTDLLNIYAFLQSAFKRLNIEVEEITSIEIDNPSGNTHYA